MIVPIAKIIIIILQAIGIYNMFMVDWKQYKKICIHKVIANFIVIFLYYVAGLYNINF